MSIFAVLKSRPKTSIGVGALAALLAIVVIFAVTYKVAPVSSGWWGPINESSGIALKGYDPVVYHTEGDGETRVSKHYQPLEGYHLALRIG